MKILFYCCEFAPEGKTGAIRPSKLVKYFSRFDCHVSVICKETEKPVHFDLLKSLDGIEIKRVKIRKFLPINDDGFWFALYSLPALLIKAISEKPDYVFVSIPVFIPSLVSMFICKLFGIKLILDYRDLWSGDPYEPKSKKDHIMRSIGRYFEPKLMNNASLVNFISSKMKSDQEKIFGKINNAVVVSTGYDSEDVESLNTHTLNIELDLGKRYISHIGMLDWDMNVAELIELIKRQSFHDNSIVFLFVGGKNNLIIEAFKDAGIYNKCKFLGSTDKLTALHLSRISQGLLILGSSSSQRLNRKVFESIAVNSNVFYYGNTESPTANVLIDCGYEHVYGNCSSIDYVANMFHDFIYSDNKRDLHAPPLALNNYDKKKIAHRFLNEIKKVK